MQVTDLKRGWNTSLVLWHVFHWWNYNGLVYVYVFVSVFVIAFPFLRLCLIAIVCDDEERWVWVGGDSKMKISAGAADWNGGKTRPNRFIDLEKSHLFCFLKANSTVSAIYATCSSCTEKGGWILQRHFATNSCRDDTKMDLILNTSICVFCTIWNSKTASIFN